MKARTKYQQFLEAEKELQEKGYCVVGNTVLIRKELWDDSQRRMREMMLLRTQTGRAN
jgi:hypothetical protein